MSAACIQILGSFWDRKEVLLVDTDHNREVAEVTRKRCVKKFNDLMITGGTAAGRLSSIEFYRLLVCRQSDFR